MTSTTDTDEHPEVSEISAMTDGLLPPSRTAVLRNHLAHCELCEDVHASLEEIRGLLGTLPGPARMPADVAGRIDAALAAEALLDSTAPTSGSSVSRETPVAAVDSVSRETVLRTPGTDSGAATRPPGQPRATTGPGRPAPASRRRVRRWPRVLLGTAVAVAVLGVGGAILRGAVAPDGHSDAYASKAPQKSSGSPSPSGLTSATVETQVHHLLASSGRKKTPEVGTRSTPSSPLRDEAATVPSCVQRGTGRTDLPLASTRETYEGKDAYLVVLSHPSDPSRVSVYVVAASCVTASPPAPGKVLLFRSYARD
ncbi:hypothetical protein [Streptomyces sp. MST-110588]|uniref:hypothetical protein n=1 Tax=Streptomyces sp. MST-110588 TaxID=2833628 RepID=UPI001F5E0A0F|nr:hypothetical protein [Streptomyces sp. MST-110588]UNO40954.1 hypothetical protein KGS77_16905 [Streptomyces sp. MST-110588]